MLRRLGVRASDVRGQVDFNHVSFSYVDDVPVLTDIDLHVKPGEIATLSVPDHRVVAKGTLRALIRAAVLTVAEFAAAV